MRRRQFLQMTVVGVAGFSMPGLGWLAERPVPWQAFARPSLLTLLGDRQRVRRIGSAFLRAFPQERAPDTLVAAITADCSLAEHVDAARLPGLLDQQVRADFAHGRTVQLEGWILSVTEARQCALYSMLTS